MTTLIVGCGYLGRRVGRLLDARGEIVFGTVRTETRACELPAWGVQPVLADVLDRESLVHLPKADRVIHAVGFDAKAGSALRDVYVDGVRNVLDALGHQTRRFVYVSATSVYGTCDGAWVDEETPTEPVTESGKVCLEAEEVARSMCQSHGLEFLVIRYSGLYGPGRIIRRSALVGNEPIAADPSTYINLIHVDDAASAAVAVLDRGPSGRTYLATDDRPLERGEFYAIAARELDAPSPRFTTSAPGATPSQRGVGNKRVSNRRMKAELDLNFTYPDVTTGLAAALREELRDSANL